MKGKRLLVVLLAFVLALTTFTACGLFGKEKDPNKNTEQNSEKETEQGTEQGQSQAVTLTDKALEGDLLIDFTKGADASVVFESDGWTNGDVFNVVWAKNNVKYDNGKMLLTIVKEDKKAWVGDEEVTFPYSAGEARTQNYYGYGDYTVKMKPSANPGTASTFFTCTGNYDLKYVLDENGNVVYNEDGTIKTEPNRHDEIDIEFLGKDTTKVQFNFFVNGKGGNEYMYDLGFDASKEYHEYGFRWEETSITWFVDGEPVYKVTTDKNATEGANVRIVEEIPYTPGRILMSHWCGNERAYGWMGEYTGNVVDNGPEYAWIKSTSKGAPLNPTVTTPGGEGDNSGTATVPEIDWSKVTAIKPTFESTEVYTVTNKDTTSNVKYSAVGGSTYINVEMDITAAAKNTNTLHLTLKNNAKTDVQVRVNVIDAELLAKGVQNPSTNKAATMNGEAIKTDLEWGGTFCDIPAGETVDVVISFTGAVEKLQLMIDSSRNDSETRSGNVTVSDIKFGKVGEIVDENTVGEYKINPFEKVMKVTKAVNVRNLPKKTGDKIGVLSKGEIVLVTGQCKQTKWYRIAYKDGTVGYVTPEYLTDAAPDEQPAPTSSNSIFISGREYTFTGDGYTVKSNKNNELNVKYSKLVGATYKNIAAGLTGLSVENNKLTLKVTNNGTKTVKIRIDVQGAIPMCKNPEGGDMKASNLYATQDGVEVYTDLEWGGSKFEIAAGKTSTLEIYFDATKNAEALLIFIDSHDYLDDGKNVVYSGDITFKGATFSKGTIPTKPSEPSNPDSGSQGGSGSGDQSGTTVDKTIVVNGKELTFNNNEYTISVNDNDKTMNVKYEGIPANSYKNINASIGTIDRTFNTFTVKVKNNGTKAVNIRVDVANASWVAANTAATVNGTASESTSEFTVAAGTASTIVITYDATKNVQNLVFYIDSYGTEATSGDITLSDMAFSKDDSVVTPPVEEPTGDKINVNWVNEAIDASATSGEVNSLTLKYEGAKENYGACASLSPVGDITGKNTFAFTVTNNGPTAKIRIDMIAADGNTRSHVSVDPGAAWWHQIQNDGVFLVIGENTEVTVVITFDPAKAPADIRILPALQEEIDTISVDLTFSEFKFDTVQTEQEQIPAVKVNWANEAIDASATSGEVNSLTLKYEGAKENYGACASLSPVGDITGKNTFAFTVTNNGPTAKIRIDMIAADGNTRSHVSVDPGAAWWHQIQNDGVFLVIGENTEVTVVITFDPTKAPADIRILPALQEEVDPISVDLTLNNFKFD